MLQIFFIILFRTSPSFYSPHCYHYSFTTYRALSLYGQHVNINRQIEIQFLLYKACEFRIILYNNINMISVG